MNPRIGTLHCIAASAQALEVARAKLSPYPNCEFDCASVDAIPLPDNFADFNYSMGVLHHLPDTQAGIEACVQKLKPGAPLLVYLYYAFDNRPGLVPLDLARLRSVAAADQPSAFSREVPNLRSDRRLLARLARFCASPGFTVDHLPLASYRDRSF